ncbi:MAG: histidine kinase [Oscillospiraceae bacterium]
MRRQTFETIRDTTYVQYSRIDASLSSVESYLSNFVFDNANINILAANQKNQSAWFSALYALQKNFNAAISVHVANDFFLYIPNSQLFVSSASNVLRDLKPDFIKHLDSEYFFSNKNSGKWVTINSNDKNYLTRVIRMSGCYVGAVVSVNTLMQPLSDGAYQDLHFDIANSNGELLNFSAPVNMLENYVSDTKNTITFTHVNDKQYLLVSHPLNNSELSLVVLSPDTATQNILKFYSRVLYIVFIGIAILLVLWFALNYIWIVRPINELTNAIHRLRSGDITAKVNTNAFCAEFDDMNMAFNDMVAEIRTLKIDVYEEQLHRKNTEIEYLKLQVTPHFLINCLNTIYQLTDACQPELTMHMVKNLSTHLRYMLNSGSSVSLLQEVNLVKNFVELSSIRYPGCIRLQTDYDIDALNATAIPLLILNFTENTVKYEVEMGKITEINIKIRKVGEKINITIWDTGQGFSPEILEKLRDIDCFIEESKGRHIGISNVFQRARHILGNTCIFSFSNCEHAGAKIEIQLPYIPYEEKEAFK